MKSVRNDLISSVVGSYLKRRQYSEGDAFKRSDLKLHQTLQEMALQGVVNSQASAQNVVALSSSEVSDFELVNQYEMLKGFISEASEPYRSQLSYFLCPMFVELYIELISSGHFAPAKKLYSNYHGLFVDIEGYSGLVKKLPTFSAQDMYTHADITEFQKVKHKVRISKDCMEYFMRYIKEAQLVTFMDLINMCFDIDICESQEISGIQLFDDIVQPEKSSNKSQSGAVKTPEKSPSTSSADAMAALKQAIKNVNDGPPCLPSVCLYTISGGFQKLINVDMSSKSVLAAAFDDSSIRLWNLERTPIKSLPAVVDISRVHLACDEVDEELENTGGMSVMKTLRGHGGPVYGLSFFPNHEILISCSEDSTVRSWSMETHTNLAIYKGHDFPVWDVDTSQFGLYFATASKDRTARLFTLDRTFPQRMFVGHSEDVDCVKFHPNAAYIATGSSDRTVRLWSVHNGKLLRVLHGHRGSIYALAFSPDGQCLVSAGEDRRIKIWDLNTSTLLKELRGHTDIVYNLSFSGDGSLLSSCGMEQFIRIWDVRRAVTHAASASSGSEGHTSPEMLASFPTKTTSHRFVRFSKKNVLLVVGVAATTPT